MGRKVITLNAETFKHECKRLESAVSFSGFKPDLIISIRTGGFYVGEEMFADVTHTSVKLQRPSTKAKGTKLRKIIKNLPRPILDGIRIAESWWLEHKEASPRTVTFTLPEAGNFRKILIVDDAVDSGATLLAVIEQTRQIAPEADVRSAVITQTTLSPLTKPDYTLYDNQTLIRFPWSLDA